MGRAIECFGLALRAGGNWNNGSEAGVWARNWNNWRSNSNNNSGFRAADYDFCLKVHVGRTGDIGMVPSCVLAKSAGLWILVPTDRDGLYAHSPRTAV